ncbi:hypothetical protein A6V39_03485 [Candidatus Mycoplasma haematobovis]|uniref:Uncharacterized protein n=1 Tax=Candidatus Mycoplasma haematobovis TaxID=432608 RepID=A0A1A9QCI4_9MOLU|nr:hypothetical protein [Candidatus Mycoplasma haematobovis]OAL09948.1 hypothetical protein A6V39_03485 [Candidatus Mycoplasma haematobovis]
MFNLTTNKIIGIAGGIASLSAGGVGIAYLTNGSKEVKNEKDITDNNKDTKQQDQIVEEKSIKDWLNTDNASILEDQDATWNDNWKAFKAGYTESKPPVAPWSLDDWNSVSSQDAAPKSFKDKCKTNASTKVSSKDDKRYTDLKKYCTKQKPNA